MSDFATECMTAEQIRDWQGSDAGMRGSFEAPTPDLPNFYDAPSPYIPDECQLPAATGLNAGIGSAIGNVARATDDNACESSSYAADWTCEVANWQANGSDGERDSPGVQLLRTLPAVGTVPFTALSGHLVDTIRSPLPGAALWDK